MFSTVPGLERPRASLHCWNEVYVSVRAAKAALFHRNPRGLSFSNDDDITATGAGVILTGEEETERGGRNAREAETLDGRQAGLCRTLARADTATP
jgi:hypothetical protein